ncbi:hypothetical protein GCM10023319_63870 [Nocardia iowensis]
MDPVYGCELISAQWASETTSYHPTYGTTIEASYDVIGTGCKLLRIESDERSEWGGFISATKGGQATLKDGSVKKLKHYAGRCRTVDAGDNKGIVTGSGCGGI